LPADTPDARERLWTWVLFAFYGTIALACLELRPLWLDEVIQLIATNSRTANEFMLAMGGRNPGAAPLGYLTQRPFVLAGGVSAFWARLPSLVFSVLACWSLLRLCQELGLGKIRLLAAGLFMVVPLQFRYAIEGRPYSQALCFSLLAMLAFLRLNRAPGWSAAFLFIFATVIAVYTQPYAILSVCGLVFWAALHHARQRRWTRALLAPACILVAALAFLPWYLLEKRQWTSGIQEHGIPHFHWTLSLAQDIFKGLSGDGFVGSAALILLVCAGLLARPAQRGLLLSSALFSLAGALAGDTLSNYFFAARQILFALPGLAILAAIGLRFLYEKQKLIAALGLMVFLTWAVQKDVTIQTDAKEDWAAASRALSVAVRAGSCLDVVPTDALALYAVFAPELPANVCVARPKSRVALVSHLYTPPADLARAQDSLRARRYSPTSTISAGGTTITLEEPPKIEK